MPPGAVFVHQSSCDEVALCHHMYNPLHGSAPGQQLFQNPPPYFPDQPAGLLLGPWLIMVMKTCQ